MCIRDSIEDDGQTVLITERIIKIHTTATDKDGNKELEAGKEVTIIILWLENASDFRYNQVP